MNSRNSRRIGWDILRISLAIEIFAFHAHMHLGVSFGCFNDFLSEGALCMTGFFILTGCVLGYTHTNKNFFRREDLLVFYKKRFISIIPLYWIIVLLYYLDTNFSTYDFIRLPMELGGGQAIFVGSFSFGHNGGTWFISCLIICYFFFPLLQILLNGLTERKLWILLIVLNGFDVYASVLVSKMEFSELYSVPWLRCVQFTIGCILAELCYTKKSVKTMKESKNINVVIAVVLLLCFMYFAVTFLARHGVYVKVKGLQQYMMYDIVGLPSFIMLILMLEKIKCSNERIRWIISQINNLAYSFFLAQFFVWVRSAKLYAWLSVHSNKLKIIIAFVLCVLIATLFHLLIEKPVIKIFEYKRIGNNFDG